MASSQIESQPRGSAEFVESSVLEAVVPNDSEIDIKDELESWDGSIEDESSSVLPFVSQRQVLLFDERVPVLVVFRTPFIEETTLKAYLKRLAITVEGVAFSTAPPPEPETKAPPPKEVIFSETIKASNEPIIVKVEDEDSSPAHIYVVWKVESFIWRPKGRFHKPAIYFQPTASLKPAEKAKRAEEDEYLPSRVPTALNLLQSFESDPALAGVHPRLSALRIGKIAPTAPVARELTRPIRTGQRRLFRALPALIWRMRYSKAQASLSDASLLASLDLEVAQVTGCRVSLEDISLRLEDGWVHPISTHSKDTSTVYRPGDQLTYLYKIKPELTFDGVPVHGSNGHILHLTVKANVLVSDDCRPTIFIEWKTAVDFTAEYNASLIKAAHRLSNPTGQVPPSKSPNPDDILPQEESLGDKSQHKPINVTLTISGPPQVQVGDIFEWNVFIVNRSDKTRKLAVLTIPKRKRDLEGRHKSNTSTSSAGGFKSEKKELLASAIVDENIVYAKQKSARQEAAELLCLTTDVRVGHLAPGACYTAELKFLALSSGILGVDAVRVVDLATQEVSDIRDLPSIVAVDKEN